MSTDDLDEDEYHRYSGMFSRSLNISRSFSLKSKLK
jgi:hypothetical protein